MIISYSELSLELNVNDYRPLVIIAENEKTFAQLVCDIKNSVENSIEAFLISEKEKSLNLSKEASVIVDPWSIDCNSKQIKTRLYQLLLEIDQEQNNESFLQLRTDMFRYVEELTEHIPYSISYNMQLDPTALFKSMDIGIDIQSVDFLERIVEYMKLMQSLCKIKVLFLVNIKSYLPDEQVELLYKEAKYINLQLILIEPIEKSAILEEKVVIIDRDNCIISI